MITDSAINPPLNRWLAMDGLRGIMTMFVFLAHVDYDLFPGAIIYMDTFFIMSSFFITRLLLKDLLIHGHINFKKFYIRRAKRLFPALIIVVSAVAIVDYFYLDRDSDKMLHVFGALFYFSNWLRALGVPHDGILGHTWSLSIEEQYYLVWPILLAFCIHQRWRGKKLSGLLLTICILSAGWRAYLALDGASIHRTYNGTDVRLDSLALGAVLALNYETQWMKKCRRIVAKVWLLWLMLVVLAVGGLLVDYRTTSWYVWQQPCFALLSLAFIIGLLQLPDRGGLKLIFENPISVYLGTICYGIYLWHFPILVIGTDVFNLTNWHKIIYCGPMTLALASLSYYLIEKPVLQSRSNNGTRLPKGRVEGSLATREP